MKVMTVDHVALIMGVTPENIYSLIKRHKLTSIKRGRRHYITPSSLEWYLERRNIALEKELQKNEDILTLQRYPLTEIED